MKSLTKSILIVMAVFFIIGGQNALGKSEKSKAKEAPAAETVVKKININTADVDTLKGIKGIGPKLAENIVAYREKVGQFKTVDDLLEVKGVGDKKLEAIRPFIDVK